jgi:hypothetical protein
MKALAFKKGLERVLLSIGFERAGKSFHRVGSGVATMVAFEKGFGNQWFIDVGFWLYALGSELPDRVEQTHLYFRLERLVPTLRETILEAGALTEPNQPQAHEKLCYLLVNDIDSTLRVLGTVAGLRSALQESRLTHGLVRKEARAYLDG